VSDPTRVLIVDDHRLFSQALELLLRGEDGIRVVGTAATGEEALEFCRDHGVDVALVDIDLPGMDGIAVTARLQESHPDLRVVVITAFQQPDVMARALRAGACGYVMKTDLADTLVGAIGMAMAGNMVLPAGRLAPTLSPSGRWGRGAAAERPPPSSGGAVRSGGPLSDREVEILQAIANGRTTFEIADSLAISEHTVRSHVKRVFSKLDAHSKAEAVRKGVHLGLISTAPGAETSREE
jgi:DNA-binding NarL/FixJ family response regulator